MAPRKKNRRLVVPNSSMILASMSPSGAPKAMKASDLSPGDFIWCFLVEAYSPKIIGHFRFIRVKDKPNTVQLNTQRLRWFSNNDGPFVDVPSDWRMLQHGNVPISLESGKNFSGFAFPGYLHDYVPEISTAHLFRLSADPLKLTESLAYFMGSLAVRPQLYTHKGDTWGIFGVKLNSANKLAKSPKAKLKSAFEKHRRSVEKLAADIWGDDFFIEQKGEKLGLPDIPIPPDHKRDVFLASGSTLGGFAVHAPIARGVSLDTSGDPKDPDLILVNYWYACMTSHLIERTTVSVRKAFLLGAWETASNLDRDRGSVGIDFIDGYVGEPPVFTVVHQIGKSLLQTFEGAATQFHRMTTEQRKRGRMPRCKIWEHITEIGWLSDLRYQDALSIDPDIAARSLARYPTLNVLSSTLGIEVMSASKADGTAANETDLTEFRIFKHSDSQGPQEFTYLTLENSSAYPVSSLPLGYVGDGININPPGSVQTKKIRLAMSGWENEALEKIREITRFIPSLTSGKQRVPDDRVFEFLVAALASRLEGCIEASVTRRSVDGGVDVESSFSVGDNSIRAVFQVKLQKSSVTRPVIDELRGALHRQNADFGFVVTNSTFSSGAVNSSQKDYPRIHLIEGHDLIHLLCNNSIGLKRIGRGRNQRVFLDLTFFEELHSIAFESRNVSGKVRIIVNKNDLPERVHV